MEKGLWQRSLPMDGMDCSMGCRAGCGSGAAAVPSTEMMGGMDLGCGMVFDSGVAALPSMAGMNHFPCI